MIIMTRVYQPIFQLAICLSIRLDSSSIINTISPSVDSLKQMREKSLKIFRNGKGIFLFEGDIILTEEQNVFLPFFISYDVRSRRSHSIKELRKVVQPWPDAIIPYQMSETLDQEYIRIFRVAMNIIENGTCIRFIPKTHETEYVFLEKNYDRACLSHLGYTGHIQKVTMADHCASVGSALHELGHTLGLWHEHSRLDRDQYIEILYHNLGKPEDAKHFAKVSREMFDSVPNVGYDLESVMHYSPFAFAKKASDLMTIKIKDHVKLDGVGCSERLPMGQRKTISFKDKQRLNLLYKCPYMKIEQPSCVSTTSMTTVPKADGATFATIESSDTNITIIPTTPKNNKTAQPYQDFKDSLILSKIVHHPCLSNKFQDTRIKNGDYITLTVKGATSDTYGMKCSLLSNCILSSCQGSNCKSVLIAFQIIKATNDGRETIWSGDTVVLMSAMNQSYFLDCSSPTKCVLSKCEERPDRKPSPCLKYSSSCWRHMFNIYGIARKKKTHLHTYQKVSFKSSTRDEFLSCTERSCNFQRRQDCVMKYKVQDENFSNCKVVFFKLKKVV